MKLPKSYDVLRGDSSTPVKAWIQGVPLEAEARKQLINLTTLPFIHKWIAAMPDVHYGKGATIGSVIATKRAIIPAAVGVDLGCGMMAVETSLKASQLPDSLKMVRTAIEKAVPHGRTNGGQKNDRGAWGKIPDIVYQAWRPMTEAYESLSQKHPRLGQGNDVNQLGTLGGGNHFIEVCLDETDHVWVMLHSGSRGVGNRMGMHFIELARAEMGEKLGSLPDRDLAYLEEGSRYFSDYVDAVHWAQHYALVNRQLMMAAVIEAMKDSGLPEFQLTNTAVNCHHNYVSKETHYGEEVYVTRKGAVSAKRGQLGIIPGSMGAKSFIVSGLGNPESFESCSHGAGRAYSRTQARKQFTIQDHQKATEGIECRKDAQVIDETPAAYKDIDQVMKAQADLVEAIHTLKQVIVVKG